MDIRVLLLLVCLCTLSSLSSLLALQKKAFVLDATSEELLHQRSSHGIHNQGESRVQGSIKVLYSEVARTQPSNYGVPTHGRQLLAQWSRQIFAIKDEEDKKAKKEASEQEKTSASSEKDAKADRKPLDETGHANSTDSAEKSKETRESDASKTSAPPPPPLATPEDKQSRGEKENNTTPDVKKPDDQVQDESMLPDKKPNVPAIHCGESHCEDPKKLVSACLRIPGDGAHLLSLLITYDGDTQVLVKIATPKYLVADRLEVLVAKGQSETVQFLMDSTYDPRILDSDTLNKTISVITEYGACEIAVPVDYLRSSVAERKPQFSSYLPSVTPRMVAFMGALLLAATALGAWLCYKCCRRKRAGDVKYQQLEMSAPPGQSTPKERDDQRADGWDEVWDDDWEDAEAAKSSSRLSPNLSSRSMGGRRGGNKDGWDTSWDD